MTETLSPAIKKVLTTRASAMFDAILDFALENPNPRVRPQVTALAITSDGFLMGWNTDRPDKEGFMGAASDLDRNLYGICKHCGLTPEETSEVVTAFYAKVTDWRTGAARKGTLDPYAKRS